MKVLLKNGTVVNVFTGELEKTNVLIEDSRIAGVGGYNDSEADVTEDMHGKILCPGFIDGHIHIESSMLIPAEFARAALPHGTTAVIADPHEIANVCGRAGIGFMLEASENIPLTVYIMVPSCVPATEFDESGAVLTAKDIETFYHHPRVLGLAEMMNYIGVVNRDGKVMEKINGALKNGLIVNGHAPLLSGKDLDKYISAGIGDDHECSSAEEAIERIHKGQMVMIRQGTAARNLEALLPLFDEPYAHRCLLVTDDKHPADLLNNGHIDDIIRSAVKRGKNPITGIKMATIQAAQCFNLSREGAIAPGYRADITVLDDLNTISVCDVYKDGKKVVSNGKLIPFDNPVICSDIKKAVCNSFYLDRLEDRDFEICAEGIHKCNIIRLLKGELITEKFKSDIDFSKNNGIDTDRDILKIAVIERHLNTGHKCVAFINGIGLKEGAIASSVSHDSHNLIVIGTNVSDMTFAANRIRHMGGGAIVVKNGTILAETDLPYGGLMTDRPAEVTAERNRRVREEVKELKAAEGIEPFMSMAFLSLPVIPHIKITTKGLIDVDKQEIIPLLAD